MTHRVNVRRPFPDRQQSGGGQSVLLETEARDSHLSGHCVVPVRRPDSFLADIAANSIRSMVVLGNGLFSSNFWLSD